MSNLTDTRLPYTTLFRSRVRAYAPAAAAAGRRGDRDARIDRQPRDEQQISLLRARAVRAQIFLFERYFGHARRRRGVGRGGEEPDQGDDRGRGWQGDSVGGEDRAENIGRGPRHQIGRAEGRERGGGKG